MGYDRNKIANKYVVTKMLSIYWNIWSVTWRWRSSGPMDFYLYRHNKQSVNTRTERSTFYRNEDLRIPKVTDTIRNVCTKNLTTL